MSLLVVILAGVGILLIYSSVKNQKPVDVVKRAFK
jgi:hypothetical protein